MTTLPARLLCSTISFRSLALPAALERIGAIGFGGIDLGALPGTCEHVPFALDAAGVARVAAEVGRSGLTVRSINADIGDLNAPLDAAGRRQRDDHLRLLLELCALVGSRGLILPSGAKGREPIVSLGADLDLIAAELDRAAEAAAMAGVELWVEAPYSNRLAFDLARARALVDRLDPAIGTVLDVSHVVSVGEVPGDVITVFGDRIRHVHLRDADAGWIHRSIGKGIVDFSAVIDALAAVGFDGALVLELETRDVTDEERPAETARAAATIARLLIAAGMDGPADAGGRSGS